MIAPVFLAVKQISKVVGDHHDLKPFFCLLIWQIMLQHLFARVPIDPRLASQICFIVCFCASSRDTTLSSWGQSKCGQLMSEMQPMLCKHNFKIIQSVFPEIWPHYQPVSDWRKEDTYFGSSCVILSSLLILPLSGRSFMNQDKDDNRRCYDKTTPMKQSNRCWDQSCAKMSNITAKQN